MFKTKSVTVHAWMGRKNTQKHNQNSKEIFPENVGNTRAEKRALSPMLSELSSLQQDSPNS